MKTPLRFWLHALATIVAVLFSSLEAAAEEIQVLPRPESVSFPKGYDVLDGGDWEAIKHVDGPVTMAVKVIFARTDGSLHYMDGPNWELHQAGKRANRIRGISSAASAPAQGSSTTLDEPSSLGVARPARPGLLKIRARPASPETASMPIAPAIPARLEQEPQAFDSPKVQLPIGHQRTVTGAIFLPGSKLVTCSEDATVIVWDLQTGLPLKRFFTPDQCASMRTASGSDHVVEVFCGNNRRGEQRVTLDLDGGDMRAQEFEDNPPAPEPSADLVSRTRVGGGVILTAMSPSGDLAAIGFEDGDVELWSLDPLAKLHDLRQEAFPVTSVSEAGGVVATWRFGTHPATRFNRHDLTFWRPGTLEVLAADRAGSGSIVSGGFLSGGNYFLSCEDNGFDSEWSLVVRDTRSGAVVTREPAPNRLHATLWFHPDKSAFVVTHYGLTGPGVSVWRFTEGELSRIGNFPESDANVAVYDRARNRVVSGVFSGEGEPGLSLQVLDAGSGRVAGPLSTHTSTAYGTTVALTTDAAGERFLLANFHRGSGFCSVGSLDGRFQRTADVPAVHTALFRPGRDHLVVAGTEGKTYVSLLDASTLGEITQWTDEQSGEFREHRVAAFGWTNKKDAVAVSSDGDTAYVVEQDGSVRVLRITERNRFEPVARMISLTDGDWAIVGEKGVYACAPAGAEKMAFRHGDEAFSFATFDLAYNRPAEIAGRLGGSEEFVASLETAFAERQAKLAESEEGMSLGAKRVRLTGVVPMATSATDIELPIEGSGMAVAAYRSGLLVSQLDPVSSGTRQSVRIPLLEGPNRIELHHLDPEGGRSLPTSIFCHREPESGTEHRLFVLTVGVSEYALPILKLDVAAKDARDVAAAFERHAAALFDEVRTMTLVDAEVTRESILEAATFFAEAQPGDAAVVFLAGHGFVDAATYDYYYGTHDIDHRKVNERGLRYDELHRLFDQCQAANRLILMDTCFAGEVERFDLAHDDAPELQPGLSVRAFALENAPARREGSQAGLRQQMFSEIRRASGANVITASGGMEFVFALETEAIGNGLFTHCLIDSLSSQASDTDGDGEIRVSELFTSVSVSLREISEGQQQSSMREVNRFSNFALAGGGAAPAFDERDFLLNLLRLTSEDGREADYARLFAPDCSYFGSVKQPTEIEAEEQEFHAAFPRRAFEVAAQPVVESAGEGGYRVNYDLRLWKLPATADHSGYATFAAEEMAVQNLELVVRYRQGQWLIEKISAIGSKRVPNPRYREN
jgi:hypothetical protein